MRSWTLSHPRLPARHAPGRQFKPNASTFDLARPKVPDAPGRAPASRPRVGLGSPITPRRALFADPGFQNSPWELRSASIASARSVIALYPAETVTGESVRRTSKDSIPSESADMSPLIGLFAAAAMAVAISSSLLYVPDVSSAPQGQPLWFAEAVSIGNCGITALFVMSGFLIHHGSSRSKIAVGDTRVQTWNFYVSVFARLYPLFIATFLLVLVERGQIIQAINSNVLLFYLTLTQSWFYSTFHGVPLLFQTGSNTLLIASLPSSIWFCCIVYPLAQFLLRRISKLAYLSLAAATVVVVTLGVFAAILTHYPLHYTATAPNFGVVVAAQSRSLGDTSFTQWLIYYSPYLRLSEFLLGVLAASVYINLQRHLRRPDVQATVRKLVYVVLALTAVAQFVVGLPSASASPDTLLRFTLFSSSFGISIPLAFLALMLVSVQDNAVARLLRSRPMILCGAISYGIYLLQFVIFGFFGIVLLGAGPNYWGHVLSIWMRVIIGLAQLIGLAFVADRAFERPVRRWLCRHIMVRGNVPDNTGSLWNTDARRSRSRKSRTVNA